MCERIDVFSPLTDTLHSQCHVKNVTMTHR